MTPSYSFGIVFARVGFSGLTHVNMRLGQRFIPRETIIRVADTYEIVEAYPEDKYFPSYLLLGREGDDAFHVLFGADVEGQNVRIITAYYPAPMSGKWI